MMNGLSTVLSYEDKIPIKDVLQMNSSELVEYRIKNLENALDKKLSEILSELSTLSRSYQGLSSKMDMMTERRDSDVAKLLRLSEKVERLEDNFLVLKTRLQVYLGFIAAGSSIVSVLVIEFLKRFILGQG